MNSILITVCGDICASCLKSLVEGDPETFYPQLQQARQVACLFMPLDLKPGSSSLVSLGIRLYLMGIYGYIAHG
jgi:hypothetical protein